MKIFIYGFKPFKQYKENVTQKILKHINQNKHIKVKIFDVLFDKNMFITEIENFNPDIILGFGQYPRGKKIRIERTAKNIMAHSKKDIAEKINSELPSKIYSTLKFKPDNLSRVTYNAGTYVCNFSMFVNISHTTNSSTKYAFFHIPASFDVKTGVNWVNNILKNQISKT
ncbi:MAG: hypothetical protein WC337_10390 [Candidatus Muiribacteriota bacterium]